MDLISGIMNVFTPINLMYCFAGCFLGTLVGVLPGLGPASTMSILLPLTINTDPQGSIIMLAGLYYGAQYGGSTTSILANIPGEPGAVATCLDGFQMTRQGRGGEALWIAAVGSFLSGTLGCIAITLIGPGIAKYALKFGPPEFFGLIFFSLMMLVNLSGRSLTKGVSAGIIGLILSAVGIDPLTGVSRLTFGVLELTRGFEQIPLIVGIFGIGEILISAEAGIGKIYEGKIGRMMPNTRELKKGLWASLRGTLIGFPLGLLPGMSAALTTFIVYDFEKRISKYPEKFGTGVIEGVASPEAANNATAQGGLVPLLTLGIPTGPSMALILAALMMYGLQPGPLLLLNHKLLFWTVIGSLYIGNVMLLVLNLPLVGLWARLSMVPYKYLAPIILAICVIGAYSPRNAMFDLWIALAGGILGYVMRKTNWPLTPLILGLILGPMLEISLRQSLSMGGFMIFISRPIPIIFFLLVIIVMIVSSIFKNKITKVIKEDEEL